MSRITLGSNIASLRAQRQLAQSDAQLATTFERLSSGLRINRASDDSASLAISENLKKDTRVFLQGIRNLNDGLSALSIADSTLNQLTEMVTRIKELAEQAANGTYGVKQRQSLDNEAQALAQEYFRIAASTRFNNINLLNGTSPELRLQAGFGIDGGIATSVGGAIGTGYFGSAASYSMHGTNTSYSDLGDINGDGNLDIVTLGLTGATPSVIVRLGNSDGSFGTSTNYFNETFASNSIELADLNNDGILDLATSGTTGGVGYATIRLGAGNGTFGSATSYVAESNASYGISFGDLNGDGILDLLTAGNSAVDGRVTVRLGNGNGTFGAATSYQMHTSALSVELADFNNDGILDMLSSGAEGGIGRIAIRLGAGNGSFGVATTYAMADSITYKIAIGDINGDGNEDVVTAGLGAGGVVTVRLGAGNGTFLASTSYSAQSTFSNSVTLGDVNGDGILDMAYAGVDGALGASAVRLGVGDGSFGAATSYNEGGSIATAANLRDVNRDGVLDMIMTGSSGSGNVIVRLGMSVSGAAPLLSFSLRSISDARQAMGMLDSKLNQLTSQRGQVGAYQSRISVALGTLQSAAENNAAATSRITDADIAEESSKLARLSILQKTASAILAQANLQPQIAINLISG